jgi:hypothetical protein
MVIEKAVACHKTQGDSPDWGCGHIYHERDPLDGSPFFDAGRIVDDMA